MQRMSTANLDAIVHAPSRARIIFILTLLVVTLPGVAYSQLAAPAASKGSNTKVLGTIDIAAEIQDLSGRQLRARLVTIEPGGQLAAHSHTGRPTLEYVIQGNVVEIRNGVEIQHSAGDMIVGTQGVTHWWENRSPALVILLPVDIFKP